MKKIIALLLSAIVLSFPITSYAAIIAKDIPDDLYADGFDYKGIKNRSRISEYLSKAKASGLYLDDDETTNRVFIIEDMDVIHECFTRAFNSGRAIYNITVPQEKVKDISSDGNVSVLLQTYDQYEMYTIDAPNVADWAKKSGRGYVGALIKGDKGEKEYTISFLGVEEKIDGNYYHRMICKPVIHHDDNVIVSKSYDRVVELGNKYLRDESGNFVYCDMGELLKNELGDPYVSVYESYRKVEDYMQVVIEYYDENYCGIKSVGLGFSDGSIYTIPAEDAIIDYGFEVKASISYAYLGERKYTENGEFKIEKMRLDDKYTPDVIAEMRSTRTVNNELENILTAEYVEDWLYGDDEPDTDISDKPIEEPVEEPDEQPGELPEDDNPELPPEDIADKTDETEDIKISLDDKELDFDSQQPLIENDRVLVPMRKIFEELGAEIEWDEETQTVTATIGDTVITLQIGKNEITKNGVTTEIDTETQLVNDRTLVPLRAVSESFGNTVTWNAETKTVEITK